MRICVFTGSGNGLPSHRRHVALLGHALAASDIGIVYGGGRVGLMGILADAALASGGEVSGVMPKHLFDREIAHQGLTRLEVVPDMHRRMARMASLADAFVALPGGAGTLEELFEVWTWGQLGLHSKPTVLYDIDDFFGALVAQLDEMAHAGYLSAIYRQSLGVLRDPTDLLRWIGEYQHPLPKWGQTTDDASDHLAESVVSVGLLAPLDGRLLAVRTRGRDMFYLPGGKPNSSETMEEALVREVREELGVRLGAVVPAFTVEAPAHGLGRDAALTMHCYYAVMHGEPRPSSEIEELAWLSIPEDFRAAPAVAEVLQRLDRSW